MKRREFLKQAGLTAAAVASTSQLKASEAVAKAATPSNPIAKRTLGKTGEQLSIIGFGGIVVMDEETGAAKNIVAEAVDRGINYFDIAPSYGNAQERLGPALAPYRKNCFLACKTEGRAHRTSSAPSPRRSEGKILRKGSASVAFPSTGTSPPKGLRPIGFFADGDPTLRIRTDMRFGANAFS
jgi:hypothetical protein